MRDKRLLEVSPGVESQAERYLVSEPAGTRDSFFRRIIQSQAWVMKRGFLAYSTGSRLG